MARVLFVSPDRVGPTMPGPGIRYVELARELGERHDVTIAAPTGSETVEGSARVVVYDPHRPRTLRRCLAEAEVVVSLPLAPPAAAGLATRRAAWIVDLFDPEPFEGLEYQRRRSRLERKVRDVARVDRIGYAARRGTAFICGNERQRDMWLGFLAASRRLDSDLYEHDPELRTLIDVVPFGISSEPPRPASPPLRGSVFDRDEKIVVWNGGLWDWLDPLTVVRALAILHADDPSWTLVFPSGRPSHRGEMEMSRLVSELADELGLREAGAVRFRDWSSYAGRGAMLLEADLAVCASPATLEARFAHRVRVVDCLWGRLPVLLTEGDEWAECITREGWGETTPPGDAEALAAAARRIVERGRRAYEPALEQAAAARTWERAAQALVRMVDAVADRRRRPFNPVATALGARHAAASAAGRVARRASTTHE
jgi:glycosyltransferase involved in cell wall biosynthesis